jgi:hypothetical protein
VVAKGRLCLKRPNLLAKIGRKHKEGTIKEVSIELVGEEMYKTGNTRTSNCIAAWDQRALTIAMRKRWPIIPGRDRP